jgi:hypothetical protein
MILSLLDLRVNLTYIINMRLLDYRPPNVAREQCSDLRGRLFVRFSFTQIIACISLFPLPKIGKCFWML